MAEERDAERAVYRFVPRQKLWAGENFATGVLRPLQEHAAAIHLDEPVIIVVGGRESNSTEDPSVRWHSIDLRLSRVSAFTAPDRLYGSSVGYDVEFPRIFVFGGKKGSQTTSDLLWQLNLRANPARPEASTIRPRGDRPAARYAHASVYDPSRHWLITYGGLGANDQPLNEGRTWVFDTNRGLWDRLDSAWIGERYGAAMVYDSFHQTPLLIAGAVRGSRDLRGTLHYLDCPGLVPEPSATAVESETATATESATPEASATGEPSDTPLPQPSATATPSPSSTSAAPGETASPTAPAAPTPTKSPPPAPTSWRLYMPLAVRR